MNFPFAYKAAQRVATPHSSLNRRLERCISVAILSYTSEFSQDVLRECSLGTKPHTFTHQLHQEVFARLADRSQVVQVNHKLTIMEVRSGSVTCNFELAWP